MSGPTQIPIQWGDKSVLRQEAKYRTRLRSWKSYLFWLIAIIAFIIFISFS